MTPRNHDTPANRPAPRPSMRLRDYNAPVTGQKCAWHPANRERHAQIWEAIATAAPELGAARRGRNA